MPTITISPTYSDGTTLTKAQLDTLVDPVTTFVNTTKLDSVNVDIQDVVDGVTSSQAGIIFSQAGLGGITQDSTTGATLTTTFATLISVTAPTAGDYLILADGIASSRRSSTAGTTAWAGYLYFEFRNTTTTTSITPTVSIGHGVAMGSAYLANRISDISFTYAYVATLAASDVVAFRAYKDSNTGVADSVIDVELSLLRLIQ